MAHVITTDCIECGDCMDACPIGAISPNPNGVFYDIDADMCVDCGACEYACPVGAIIEE